QLPLITTLITKSHIKKLNPSFRTEFDGCLLNEGKCTYCAKSKEEATKMSAAFSESLHRPSVIILSRPPKPSYRFTFLSMLLFSSSYISFFKKKFSPQQRTAACSPYY